MSEITNPVQPGVNERAILIARRNSLMNELLRIAPLARAATPPSYKAMQAPKRPTVVLASPEKQVSTEKKPSATKKPKVARNPKVTEPNEKSDSFADNPSVHTIRGVHMDLYDYFGLNADRLENGYTERLQFIHNWVFKNGKNFRDGMMKLNRLDIQLGAGDEGTAKVSKIYNWLRLRSRNVK